MSKTILQHWDFPYSPETVWKYLTTSELLGQWLMENDFKPVVGHEFMFRAKPRIKMGFDGNIYCKVLEVKPPERLAYSWKGGPGHGKITLDSVVTWTLYPIEEGTRLQLEHAGFTGRKNFISYLVMNKGWKINMQKHLLRLIQQNHASH